MFFRKKEGRKEKVKGMIEAVNKFIPFFVGLLLILRGLLWIVDGKNGNKRSYFFGIIAIVVGIIMFITVFLQVLNKYLAEYEKAGIRPRHFESMTDFAEDYNKEISEEI